ncbi:hypothetical protein IWQ60_009471 [Tieghemiomyces parasiticus]|uniref:GATA-type domain-containing protein n=1 Tax=Tieghemiomyces parasiticus TaxID=78921 RepID=A0A9W7ZT20_9FUNG|nr:hypothetical protein IWQ60_009471 [Tieghemiomyces parasiticus]
MQYSPPISEDCAASRSRVQLPGINELSRSGVLPPLRTALANAGRPAPLPVLSPLEVPQWSHGRLTASGFYTPPTSPMAPHHPMGPAPLSTSCPSPRGLVRAAGWPYPARHNLSVPGQGPESLPGYAVNRNPQYWSRKVSNPIVRSCNGAMRKCANCQTTNTRAWRPGPTGSATLCDRCGKKYKRKLAHGGRSASPSGEGHVSLLTPSSYPTSRHQHPQSQPMHLHLHQHQSVSVHYHPNRPAVPASHSCENSPMHSSPELVSPALTTSASSPLVAASTSPVEPELSLPSLAEATSFAGRPFPASSKPFKLPSLGLSRPGGIREGVPTYRSTSAGHPCRLADLLN